MGEDMKIVHAYTICGKSLSSSASLIQFWPSFRLHLRGAPQGVAREIGINRVGNDGKGGPPS